MFVGGKCEAATDITVSEGQEEVCDSDNWTQVIWWESNWCLQLFSMLTADIDLRKASKLCAQHFSCGSSVTGEDEVVVQGDVYDGIVDFIQEKWPQAGSVAQQVFRQLLSCTGDG